MTPTPRDVWHFDTQHIGRRVLVYDWLPSTNDLALTMNDPGTVVVADVQTAGRGQYERKWQSRPGCSLLMSVTLAPPPELNRAAILIAWAAVAVGTAIQSLTGHGTRIKWPNDLLLNDRKVCGILTEQQAATIIGIGVNLNQSAADFQRGELPLATSLAIATGSNFECETVLNGVLKSLDAEWHRLMNAGSAALELIWKERIGLMGRHVRVDLVDGTQRTGRLRDMGFDGIELDAADGPALVVPPEHVRQMKPA